MSTTIYEKNAGGLITTGERSVQTFPSGLVRVDRKYIGAQGNESAHRAILAVDAALPEDDGAPAIDGLYIFPDIQESKNGTGFATYLASAYGRTTTAGRITGYTQETFSVPYSRTSTGKLLGGMSFVLRSMAGSIVIPRDAVLTADDITIPDSIYNPSQFSLRYFPDVVERNVSFSEEFFSYSGSAARRYEINFGYTDGSGSVGTISLYLLNPRVQVTAQRNFGQWTELEYVTVRDVQYETGEILS